MRPGWVAVDLGRILTGIEPAFKPLVIVNSSAGDHALAGVATMAPENHTLASVATIRVSDLRTLV